MRRRTSVRLSSLCLAAATCLLTGAAAFAQSGATNGPALLVDDIFPGSDNAAIHRMTAIGNYVSFYAYYADYKNQMYLVDKPQNGATPAKEIFSEGVGRFAGGVYYTTLDTPEYGRELYRVEPGGDTTLLKDISPGPGDGLSLAFDYDDFSVAFQGKLYFLGREGDDLPFMIWSSDGTPEGTVKVSSVSMGMMDGANAGRIFNDDTLIFYDTSVEGKIGWWVLHDGKLINLYTVDGSYSQGPYVVAATDTRLIALETLPYNQETGLTERVVWSYARDGSGRVRIGSLKSGSSEGVLISRFTRVGDKLFFIARDDANLKGTYLFMTDGTADSMQPLVDDVSIDGPPIAIGDTVYFQRWQPNGTLTLWRTNETSEETFQLPIIPRSGRNGIYEMKIYSVGGKLLVLTEDSIWATNGTEIGTNQIIDYITIYPLAQQDVAAVGDYSNSTRFLKSGTLTAGKDKNILNEIEKNRVICSC